MSCKGYFIDGIWISNDDYSPSFGGGGWWPFDGGGSWWPFIVLMVLAAIVAWAFL